MTIEAGKLWYEISIEQRGDTRNTYGESVASWSEYLATYADMIDLSGAELEIAQQINSNITTKIITRWDSGIRATMRVLMDGEYYNIVSVDNVDERDKIMVLLCERIETANTVEAPSFDPLDLTPLIWLDASDTDTITESAGKVTQWDDKSGNANHFTQASTSIAPTTGTTTINSKNVLDWGSSGNDINLRYTNTLDPQDIYIVCRYDDGATFTTSFITLISAFNASGSPNSGLCILAASATTTNLLNINWWDNLYIDNSEILSPFTVLPALNSPAMIHCSADSDLSVNGLCLGDDRSGGGGGGGRGWRGVVAEVFIFDYKLSASERSDLKSYVDSKWAL